MKDDYEHLLGCSTDKKSGFERPKLFTVVQIDENGLLIDGEAHVVLVVIDPDLLPLSRVQVTRALHRHVPRFAVDGELERQFVICLNVQMY